MKAIILLLVFSIVFNSCKSGNFYKSEPKTPDIVLKNCPDLLNFISTEWRINKAGNLHRYNKTFIPKLQNDYGTCLRLLSKQDIIDLFGIPNQHFDGYLNYYLEGGICNTNLSGTCKLLSFNYDTKTGKFITPMEMSNHTME